MGFAVIDTLAQLDEALEFLSRGFGWQEARANRFRNSLIEFNSDFPYGAVVRNQDDELVIAILFFHQGEVLSPESGTRSVVNLSSWYAIESHRGMDAVLFANRVVSYLRARSCITTDYTPSDAAKSVFRALGLRFQSSVRLRWYAWSRYTLDRCLLADVNVASRNALQRVSGFACAGNLMTCRMDLRGCELNLAFTVTRVKKFGASLRLVHLFWADNYDLLAKNVKTIGLRLLLQQKAVAADIYLQTTMPHQPSSSWLIDDTMSEISFVPPLQSELTCI